MDYSEDQIRSANKTARSAGAVGENAVVPTFVLHMTSDKTTILDYGAGPAARHASFLISAGRPYTGAYDFGANFKEGIHMNPDNVEWDVIYASNVLNVQTDTEMLFKTLVHINKLLAPYGKFVCNYPQSPRKMPDLTKAALVETLGMFFKEVETLPKNVILCRQPI